MRYFDKPDAATAEIVKVLRNAGVDVEYIKSSVGGSDIPDLLCGFRKLNILLEVKTPSKTKRKVAKRSKLSPGQVEWHRAWRGQVAEVETPEEALAVFRLVPAAKGAA